MYRVQQHEVRLASDSYTEHTEAEASQALGDCVAWLDCSAPLCHGCALAVCTFDNRKERGVDNGNYKRC